MQDSGIFFQRPWRKTLRIVILIFFNFTLSVNIIDLKSKYFTHSMSCGLLRHTLWLPAAHLCSFLSRRRILCIKTAWKSAFGLRHWSMNKNRRMKIQYKNTFVQILKTNWFITNIFFQLSKITKTRFTRFWSTTELNDRPFLSHQSALKLFV